MCLQVAKSAVTPGLGALCLISMLSCRGGRREVADGTDRGAAARG